MQKPQRTYKNCDFNGNVSTKWNIVRKIMQIIWTNFAIAVSTEAGVLCKMYEYSAWGSSLYFYTREVW